MSSIPDRIRAVRSRIDAASAHSPHSGPPVTVIAVTKHHPASVVETVAAAGLLDIGENRIQEALGKAPYVRTAVHWHLIGHLQRNKVNKALTLFRTIHSIDSSRLIDALGAAAQQLDIFLQINVSGEASKSGAAPAQAGELLRAATKWPSLRVLGLMTMAPYAEDPEAARPHFRMLLELRDALNSAGDAPPMRCLSMGMSGDFEVAIEEGSTHVRIGSAIVSRNAPLSG